MSMTYKKYGQSIQIQTVKLIGLIILTLLFGGCSNNEEEKPINQEPDPGLGPKPVLWNLGVDFDSAFTLERVGSLELKFLEFGFEVIGFDNETKALPHFTYIRDRTTEIISPMKG